MATPYREDPRAVEHMRVLSERLLDKLLPDIANDAQRYAPVDTGYLRSHIGHDKLTPTHGRVYADAEYAAAVERGHINSRSGRHVPAQPYLRPAAFKHRSGE